MKFKSYFINYFDKSDWHVNLVPGINFGNQAYGSGFVINITWIVWCWNISVWFKNHFDKKRNNMNLIDAESIELAEMFSQEYKNIPGGKDITLPDSKHIIQYMEQIKDDYTGRPLNSLVRVGHSSGIIQVDRKMLLSNENYSKN